MSDLLDFPQYAPDLSPFGEDESSVIQNVYPRKDGYGPAPAPSVFSQPLPAQCRGMFSARNADGTITLFAATSTRLWKMLATDFSWVPVSKVEALTSISNASPAVFTLTAHGMSIGDAIVLSTTGALPTGLTVGTVYYVATTSFTTGSFKVSTTLAGALAGTGLVNTSSAGSGTHSITANYAALPSSDQWQFAQFNNLIFAVQINVPPQQFDLTASAAFVNVAGSPPQARYVSIVGRFVVLTGLGSSVPYRIQWSGLNDVTNWTSGVGQSDFQDFPDGGIVRGVAGSEFSAIVFQDTALRRMTYVGGTLIFQFERISESKGLFAPYSLIHGGDRVFYIGNDGFQVIAPGGYPQQIGKERVDRTFFGDVDPSQLRLIIGTSDPKTTRVYWVYKPQSGVANMWSKALVYDYALDKWTPVISWTGEYIATMATPGLTLENLDSINASIDALPFSLDNVSTGSLAAPAMFDASHQLNFFQGANLEATLDTSEQGMDGAQRIRVRNFRPATDAKTVFGSIGARENLQQNPTYLDEQAVTGIGIIPLNVSTRFARGRVRIPAGTAWTFIQGIEPVFTREGQR
jgi:hypothetical protein